jgi:hypothetical protein
LLGTVPKQKKARPESLAIGEGEKQARNNKAKGGLWRGVRAYVLGLPFYFLCILICIFFYLVLDVLLHLFQFLVVQCFIAQHCCHFYELMELEMKAGIFFEMEN